MSRDNLLKARRLMRFTDDPGSIKILLIIMPLLSAVTYNGRLCSAVPSIRSIHWKRRSEIKLKDNEDIVEIETVYMIGQDENQPGARFYTHRRRNVPPAGPQDRQEEEHSSSSSDEEQGEEEEKDDDPQFTDTTTLAQA